MTDPLRQVKNLVERVRRLELRAEGDVGTIGAGVRFTRAETGDETVTVPVDFAGPNYLAEFPAGTDFAPDGVIDAVDMLPAWPIMGLAPGAGVTWGDRPADNAIVVTFEASWSAGLETDAVWLLIREEDSDTGFSRDVAVREFPPSGSGSVSWQGVQVLPEGDVDRGLRYVPIFQYLTNHAVSSGDELTITVEAGTSLTVARLEGRSRP